MPGVLILDELQSATEGGGIKLAAPLQTQDGADLLSPSGQVSVNFDNVANNVISGDKIHGGIISGFSSTGIQDNANNVAMIIDSDGNVGIGIDSPSAVLHTVSSASSAQTGAILSNYNATAGTSQAIQLDFGLARNSGTFKSSAGRIAVGRSNDWTNDDTQIDAYMSFSTYTNNVLEEYMRIDGNDVGIGIAGQQNVILTVNGRIEGGFGARTTGGTADWNDASNARSGCGYTLLLGTATNGPGGSQYYHSFTFEYNYKNGAGNMTQLAIGYNSNNRWMRTRYGGNWTAWSAF